MEEVNNWRISNNMEEDIVIEEFWVRENLYPSLNHLVGYMKYDLSLEQPVQGLEKKYNNILEGKQIQHKIYVNTHRKVLKQEYSYKYKKGQCLKTTIWLKAQKEAEKLIGNYKGSILVINDKGEILVHLCSPYLQVYENFRKKNNGYLNKIIQERYPPGSIFKIISGLVFLKNNSFKPVLCRGFFELGKRKFHCWKRSGHGYVNSVEEALALSCNIFFYENSLKTPTFIDDFMCLLYELGLGQKTQQELSGEIKSSIKIKQSPSQIIMAAIGQGTTVSTIIQNIVLISSIMTGNKITPKFTMKYQSKNYKKLQIPADHLEIIRRSLYKNFQIGTCKALGKSDMTLFGKTSTSQVMSLDSKNYKKEHSMFVGGVKEGPFYISTIIENMGFGSQYAGKIASDLLSFMIKNQNDII